MKKQQQLTNLRACSYRAFIITYTCLLGFSGSAQAADEPAFPWPDGKRAAVSFTFDDGRASQLDTGLALMREYGVRVTFYVMPGSVEQRLDRWKTAVTDGHEIGNHSVLHPCSGNFAFAREKALETYSIGQMEDELALASAQIEELLGVKPVSFAYPCGQTYVGRGVNTQSYVPVVARLFESGRGWLDEAANDPAFCDTAQLLSMSIDNKRVDEILPLLENTLKQGHWLILTGHEMDTEGSQTTYLETLRRALEYLGERPGDFWVAPVRDVVRHVEATRDPLE